MQSAATIPSKKKMNKWVKGALYAGFALAVAGHGYRDYQNSEIRAAQEELINAQDDLIAAQALKIEALQQGGASSEGDVCAYDHGFVIPELKRGRTIEIKTVKHAVTIAPKTI
jgi:hypothetical protein